MSGNIVYNLTEHLSIFLVIKSISCFKNNTKTFTKDCSNFDESDLIDEFIQSSDWKGE